MTSVRLAGAIQLPDGTWIRGRGLRDPTPAGPVPDFAVYLGSDRLRRRHDAALSWPHEWVRWPDFLLPLHWRAAAESIIGVRQRVLAGHAVEVACNGGRGRTGTVIACLAVTAGLTADEAVRWTRTHYHPKAIETPWQRRWIAWYAQHTGQRRATEEGAGETP